MQRFDQRRNLDIRIKAKAMKKIGFYKLEASGNDFILLDQRRKSKGRSLDYKNFAKKYCQRKLGIGADGLLVIEPSRKAAFKMRIFNADGSEAEMCGNGARAVGLWARKRFLSFETKAGIIESELSENNVKIKVTNPFGLKRNVPIKVLGRNLKVNFINTGVPHLVILVESLEKIDVDNIGRAVRFHKKFQPAGANVNFVEVEKKDFIRIRTYERGVEAETLACGTGTVASAIVATRQNKIKVKTKSGEILKVYSSFKGNKINNVWLEGRVSCLYKGELII